MDPSGSGTVSRSRHSRGNEEQSNSDATNTSQYPLTEYEAHQQKTQNKNHHGWRRIVLNFTPSWFSATMGTGIASILLHNLPYNGRWLYWISVVIFCLNILLFVLFTIISLMRYIMFPGLFMFMVRHPVQSLFLGTIPMGLATIINMVVFVCVPAWGHPAIILAWVLWWIDVTLAVATCFWLPFVIMYLQDSPPSKMTATWLLPIVATIVASASGGVVAEVLPNPQHALWTIVTSYIIWGSGFSLSLVVLTLYFYRLTTYHLPAREVIVSVFIPLGPLGQGSFALQQLGKVALKTFPVTNTFTTPQQSSTFSAGEFFYHAGNYASLVLWGYASLWLFFAVASITRSKFPFNMGWWGFTFPLGVYSVATTTIAKEMPSLFFKVVGTIFSLVVVFLWAWVSIMSVVKVARGEMFYGPCVKEYERYERKKSEGREKRKRQEREGNMGEDENEDQDEDNV